MEQAQKQELAQAQSKAREALMGGELIPEWADSSKLDEGLDGVGKYLAKSGYPSEVLAMLADPIAISIAEKARRYDELQKIKPEAKRVVKSKPKVIKAGSKNTASKSQTDTKAIVNRFRQTKSNEDGLAALAALRKSAS